MSTSSTVPTVKAALVSLLGDALTAPQECFYAWPGPNAPAECIYLDRHPELVANPLTSGTAMEFEIPVMTAGRKQRQETYDIEGTIWSFRPDLSPMDAAEAEQGAFDMFDVLDDVLANDPRLGLTVIQHAVLDRAFRSVVPFQNGWAAVIVPTIVVEARLT